QLLVPADRARPVYERDAARAEVVVRGLYVGYLKEQVHQTAVHGRHVGHPAQHDPAVAGLQYRAAEPLVDLDEAEGVAVEGDRAGQVGDEQRDAAAAYRAPGRLAGRRGGGQVGVRDLRLGGGRLLGDHRYAGIHRYHVVDLERRGVGLRLGQLFL